MVVCEARGPASTFRPRGGISENGAYPAGSEIYKTSLDQLGQVDNGP